MPVPKHEAVLNFQRHGMESLPARIVASKADLDALFRGDFADISTVTIRACGSAEEKNLPRLVGASRPEAAKWIHARSSFSNFVVQPYDDLLFSLELVVTDQGIFAELVPGIWELDNVFTPATVWFPARSSLMVVSVPLSPQLAKFWNASQEAVEWEQRLVEDWQMVSTAEWLDQHSRALQDLTVEIGEPLGIKAHFSRCYGISPQNIHTENVAAPSTDEPEGAPHGTPVIVNTSDEVPNADSVVLRAAIGREAHSALVDLIERLQAGGVRSVYLQSGLLSHLAITLREHGFEVRRA